MRPSAERSAAGRLPTQSGSRGEPPCSHNVFVAANDGRRSEKRRSAPQGGPAASSFLTVEGSEPARNPTEAAVLGAIDSLDADGAPGYLFLHRPGDGYVLVTGGNGAYLLARRDDYPMSPFYVAGGRSRKRPDPETVRAFGFAVPVLETERLSAREVKYLAAAFLRAERWRACCGWRRLMSGMLPETVGGRAVDAVPARIGPKPLQLRLELVHLFALLGNARARYELGDAFRRAEGVHEDIAAAAHWIRAAAEQGEADAQNDLGCMFLRGLGVEEDHAQAFRWFARAAQAGGADALYNLGECHFYGRGTAPDLERARECFSAAAAKGDIGAICQLGTMYRFGHGGPRSIEAAAAYHVIAALEGDITAIGNLADYRQEIEAAALAGSRSAALSLAKMHERGLGVEQSRAEMLAWLMWAEKDCRPDADEVDRTELARMSRFNRGLATPEQQRQAEAAYERLGERARPVRSEAPGGNPAQPPEAPDTITLREEHSGEDSRYLRAHLSEKGDLVVTGHDMGPGVENFWGQGRWEYEWRITVRAPHVPKLVAVLGGREGDDVLALLAARGPDAAEYVSREFLEKHGIPVEFWNWVGGD